LKKTGKERPRRHGGKSVAGEGPEERPDPGSCCILKTVVQELDSVEEEKDAAEKADENHSFTMPNFSLFVKPILAF
jgi:hypothetical protein